MADDKKLKCIAEKKCLGYQGHRDPDTTSSKNEDKRPIGIQRFRVPNFLDVCTLAGDLPIWPLARRGCMDIYIPGSSEYTEAGKKYLNINNYILWCVCTYVWVRERERQRQTERERDYYQFWLL